MYGGRGTVIFEEDKEYIDKVDKVLVEDEEDE